MRLQQRVLGERRPGLRYLGNVGERIHADQLDGKIAGGQYPAQLFHLVGVVRAQHHAG